MSGEVFEPWRARPVPFCLNGFLPPPETSPRVLTLAVPWRWFPRWRFTDSHRRCSCTCWPNSSSGSAAVPFAVPSAAKILASISAFPLGDEHEAVRRTRDRATHHEHVLFRVHRHDFEVLDGQVHAAHAARQALALHDARRIRRGADRAGLLAGGRTVRCVPGDELVALDDARESAALRHALHVHVLALLEDRDRQALPDLVGGLRVSAIIGAELAHVARRRQVALRELPEHRARETKFLVGAEAELDRGVAVLVRRAHLGHRARPGLNDRDGKDVALLVEQLGHADLLANESDHVLISMSTPAGMSSFSSASMVWALERVMSISRLWMRTSNCSRDFLSTCGLRSTVYTVFLVGSGTGPEVTAPVRRAVRTISDAD